MRYANSSLFCHYCSHLFGDGGENHFSQRNGISISWVKNGIVNGSKHSLLTQLEDLNAAASKVGNLSQHFKQKQLLSPGSTFRDCFHWSHWRIGEWWTRSIPHNWGHYFALEERRLLLFLATSAVLRCSVIQRTLGRNQTDQTHQWRDSVVVQKLLKKSFSLLKTNQTTKVQL